MKILEKRPLALILCIMLGGFSFFIDFDWKIRLIIASVALLTIGLIYIFESLKRGRNVIVVLSLVAFAISIVASVIWSSIFYPIKIYDTNATIKARVYEIDNSNSSTTAVVCKTEKINGSVDRHTFIAYVDKETAVLIRKYDIIEFTADVNAFSSYDNGFDGRSYYVSKGYSALLDNVNDLIIIENRTDCMDLFFDDLQLKISNTLKLRTNFETGAFLSALIVGDRSDLSGNTRLNFARLGISHILALSGMHLAILSIALNFVLIRLGVRKKLRVSILTVLIIFYMALTGFMTSVLRSGLMLIISCLLYLLSKKSDTVTSLLISVFLIVLADPASVYDLSLWLSAFATLGVIVFSEISEKTDKNDSRRKKLWIAFKNACNVSIFAFCATFALAAIRFDAFSVASVFTTLIFSFVIQFFIYGGMLLLLFGGLIPFGKILIIFSDAILWLAELISSIKFIYVSMNFFLVKLLIVILSVFFFAFLVLEIKNKKRCVTAMMLMLLSVFAVAEAHTLVKAYEDDVIYAPNTSGDILLLKSDGDATAIYSGKSYLDEAWDILDYFTDEDLTYIDDLVFVSYSYYTMDFAHAIIDGIKVERIMLPRPSTDDEIAQAEGISDLLSGYGTKLKFYDILEYVEFGEYKYRLFEKVDYEYGKYPTNVYEIVCGDDRATYLSACKYEDLSASAKALIHNSKNLIIGTIGNSNYYIFDMRLPKAQQIIYYDSGRLTEDAEMYYKEKGATVYCTKTPLSLFD